MPRAARNAVTIEVSASVVFSAGIFTVAMAAPTLSSAQDLEEKLHDLHVANGLLESVAPSVQPMAAKEEGMTRRLSRQDFADGDGQRVHVLVVLDDRNPLAVRVRGHAF